MKRLFILTFIFILIESHCFSQATNKEYNKQKKVENAIKEISSRLPVLKLPPDYDPKTLPSYVDNSKLIFFPEITNQLTFPSCQQESGVYYNYTYETDRQRNIPADIPENKYPSHYTWNYLNNEGWNGLNFLYSFDVIKKQGIPSIADYGYDSIVGDKLWMNGYDKYYHGMHNRLSEVFRIPLNTEEGILTAKAYLFDHLNGSPTGGVFTFNASNPWNYHIIPAGTPEAGKYIMPNWSSPAGHGMTIVGYNDSIRYDLNGDGIYSNQLDNNNDGVIDVRDWEIGAFIYANSFGKDWANSGFCYVLYSAMAKNYGEGGVSEQSGYTIRPKTNYEPLLTMKVKMTHNSREDICIKAGVTTDTSKIFPDHVIDFPIYNYQGGAHFMQGIDTADFYKTIEFGLDITPLLSYINSGEPAKFFLIVTEQDASNNADGIVQDFSVFSYNNGVQEFESPQHNVTIANNSSTILVANGIVNFNKVQITNNSIPAFVPGQPYSEQLQAQGGSAPYSWNLVKNYFKYPANIPIPLITQNSLDPPNLSVPSVGIALPFQFPFYGHLYDSIYINLNGFIAFQKNTYPYPYCKDEVLMMKSLKSICTAFSEKMEDFSNIKCWYEINSQWAGIRWSIAGTQSGLPITLNTCIRLYPSGEFEIIYGDMLNANQYPFALGISEGNEVNYQLEYEWDMNQRALKSYRYLPEEYPNNLILSKDGILTFENINTSNIYDVTVQVNDDDMISTQKTFTVSSGLNISASYSAGNDDKLQLGENANVDLSVKNISTIPLQNIILHLSDPNTIFNIVDSTETIPLLNPGDSIFISNAFCFNLQNFLPDGFISSLVISAESNNKEWNKKFPVSIASPRVEMKEPYIFDGSNKELDPGETVELIIPIINTGSITSKENTVELTLNDPYVSLLSSGTLYIDSLKPFLCSYQRFLISASRNTPLEYTTTFSVSLKSSNGNDTVFHYPLEIGTPSVIIINLSSSSVTADSLQPILNSLQMSYKIIDSIPPHLSPAPCVFLLLGFFGFSHTLTAAEGNYLSEYLNNGGNLYMEGYKTWHFNNPVSVLELFHYNHELCSRYSFDTIIGQNNTITQGQNFNYMGLPYIAIFRITPGYNSYSLFNNVANNPECVQFAHTGTNYKTIGSMIEFGKLVNDNDPLAKTKLFNDYLDFFNVHNPNIQIFFHADNTSVCQNSTVNFVDDSYDNILSWQWSFPGGNPSSSDKKQPAVTYESPGKYDVTLTVSDGTNNITLEKKEFITVNDCTHIPDNSEQSPILIYPNPAKDFVFIKNINSKNTFNGIELINLHGKTLIKEKINAENTIVCLDISKITRGIYFLRLTGKKFTEVKKIVIL